SMASHAQRSAPEPRASLRASASRRLLDAVPPTLVLLAFIVNGVPTLPEPHAPVRDDESVDNRASRHPQAQGPDAYRRSQSPHRSSSDRILRNPGSDGEYVFGHTLT